MRSWFVFALLSCGAVAASLPLGLPPLRSRAPADPPARITLGKRLFFDAGLSADGTVSCASCHRPEHALADPRPVSLGVGGRLGKRNAPTVLNRVYGRAQFWDGRAATLEQQALGPLLNPVEMANTEQGVLQYLRGEVAYREQFRAAFGDDAITLSRLAQAIAAFERTLLSGNSRWDRFMAGDRSALNESEQRGRELFFGAANCSHCHSGPNLSSDEFANVGAGQAQDPDEGRYAITWQQSDWRRFKTPTLRDISRTAPYMHDGSLATLEEVMDFYDKGGEPSENKDDRVQKLKLTAQQKADLIAFLRALDGDGWQTSSRP